MSAADDEVMKELVRKGTIHRRRGDEGDLAGSDTPACLEREKARSKEAEKNKPGQ